VSGTAGLGLALKSIGDLLVESSAAHAKHHIDHGIHPNIAWEFARRIWADDALNGIQVTLSRTPAGAAWIAAQAQEWAALGFQPPWGQEEASTCTASPSQLTA
jgi:hypothetical protein